MVCVGIKPCAGLRSLGVVAIAWTLVGCGESGDATSARPLETVRVVSEVGTRPGQVAYPRAMDAGPEAIWVIDKTARVQAIDPETGRARAAWYMPSYERGKPAGVTIAAGVTGEPAIYVADTHENRVLVFDLASAIGADDTPEPIAEYGEYGFGDGQIVYTTDIAVLEDEEGRAERVYVSEYGGKDRVSAFDADGSFLFSFGSFGDRVDHPSSDAVFNRPQSIAIDADRNELLVADSGNHRIGRFTLDGELLGWFDPLDETGEPLLNYPYGLQPLGGGVCAITEVGANAVRVIDLRSSEILATWGVPGREVGELATPWGIARLGDELFVLDTGNHRMQVVPVPIEFTESRLTTRGGLAGGR